MDIVDTRIINVLPEEMWKLALSYLPIYDVLKVPPCSRFLNETVWGKGASVLLWREMNPAVLETRTRTYMTPLMHAVWKNAPAAHIKTLIDGGADVNAVRDDTTALALAHRSDVVEVLLNAGADPDTGDLCIASNNGQLGIVCLLLDAGANVNQIGRGGMTALACATLNNHIGVVRRLLDAGADMNIKFNDANDPDRRYRSFRNLSAKDIAQFYARHEIARIFEEAQNQKP